MICVEAVLLAFAEEVSVRVICVAAVILVSADEVSVSDLYRRRVSSKHVMSERPTKVSRKSVTQ